MSRLAETVSGLVGRVEVLARGAGEEQRRAMVALGARQFATARRHAREILRLAPRSPVGLALWADAAEGCGLDAEVVEALGELSGHLPWRHDLWLRLGQAGLRTGWPQARVAFERAAGAPAPSEVARAALLGLADFD